jgi:hypothetical protein
MNKRAPLRALWCLLFALPLAGCTSTKIAVITYPQEGAPVRIVNVIPTSDNVLASVQIKSFIDRPAYYLDVAWEASFEPPPGAADFAGPILLAGSQVIYSDAGPLLKPREQAEIVTLSQPRKPILDAAEAFYRWQRKAKIKTQRLDVRVGVRVACVLFDGRTIRDDRGKVVPDWREEADHQCWQRPILTYPEYRGR